MFKYENVNQPTSRKGKETFQTIVNSGEKLFSKNTYPATSIEMIAEDAKLGVGTFYRYFNTKQAFFRYLVLTYHHDIRFCIAEATKNLTSREEIEKTGFKAFFTYIIKNPYAYTIIWQSLIVDKPLFIYYYTSFAEKYAIGLKAAMEKGEVTAKIDTMNLAYSLMGITNFLGLKIIAFTDHDPDEDEIDKIVDDAMQLLRKGMFTY